MASTMCTYIYERKSNKDILSVFVYSHCIYTDINICLLLDVLTMHMLFFYRMDSAVCAGHNEGNQIYVTYESVR